MESGATGERFGFADVRFFEPKRWLDGGDSVKVGELEFEVRH